MFNLSISIVLSLAAYALSVWLGRKNPAKASMLTAGMLVLILITPLFLLLPKWSVEVPWLQSSTTHGAPLEAQAQALWLLPTLWVVGSLTMLVRHIQQVRILKEWRDEAYLFEEPPLYQFLTNHLDQKEIAKFPAIKISEAVASPIVTGLFRPTIILPSDALEWDRITLKMVLMHELRHIHRKDLWLAHAAHLTCILYWFNPLVWLLKKRLKHQCEFAVDAELISQGIDAKAYIHALCNVAESMLKQTSVPAVALAMADQATLRNRVDNLLHSRGTQRPYLVLSLLGLSFTTTFAMALVNPISPLSDSTLLFEHEQKVYSPQEIETRLTASAFPMDD